MKGSGDEGKPILYSVPAQPVTTKGVGGVGKGLKGRLACLICCGIFIGIVVIIIAVISGAMGGGGGGYMKLPTYHVHSFVVKDQLRATDLEFLVDVKTNNPNKNIGYIYGADANVSLLYGHAVISSGKLPAAFKQDPTNTTLIRFALTGKLDGVNHGGSGVPLVVKLTAPMKIFVGKLHSKEFMASVTCDLVVDNLEKGKPTKVLHSQCKPDVKF